MHQNEEKIERNKVIAMMALNGLYDKYLNGKNKNSLCSDMQILIEFCDDNNLLKEDDILTTAINSIIVEEDLIKWQKERPTSE